MGESIKTDKGTAPREVSMKPQDRREDVRWPSAVTSGGGVYIAVQMKHCGEPVTKEG